MLINDQWAEKIARHSAFIHFSLNAATAPTHERINRGSRWTRVMENIQRVRSARDKHNSQLQIRGHMTIVIQNLHEIPQFIRNYVGFGFDWADFGCDYKVPFYLRLHPSFKKGLKAQISEALRDVTSPDTLGLHHLKLLGLAD
jgi:sulfatase maturation enzyme AslB (radical SAM superfamily)